MRLGLQLEPTLPKALHLVPLALFSSLLCHRRIQMSLSRAFRSCRPCTSPLQMLRARQAPRFFQHNTAIRSPVLVWSKPKQQVPKSFFDRFSAKQIICTIVGTNVVIFGSWVYGISLGRRLAFLSSVLDQADRSARFDDWSSMQKMLKHLTVSKENV